MTTEQMRAWVRESRAAQGLPPSITDPQTVQTVTELVAAVLAGRQGEPKAVRPDAA